LEPARPRIHPFKKAILAVHHVRRAAGVRYVSRRLSHGKVHNRAIAGFLLWRPSGFLSAPHAVAQPGKTTSQFALSREVKAMANFNKELIYPQTLPHSLPSEFEGAKVVIAMSRFVIGGGAIETDMTYHLVASAYEAGLEPVLIDLGAIARKSESPEEYSKEVIRITSAEDPVAILIDGNAGQASSIMNRHIAESMVRRTGSPLGVLMPDNWSDHYARNAYYWAPIASRILYLDPDSPVADALAGTGRGFQWLHPKSQAGTSFEDPQFDVGFRGSYHPGRDVWLRHALICARRLQLKTDFVIHERKESDPQVIPYANYLAKIGASRSILNITRKTATEWIINGRSLETLLASRVLLQQEGPGVCGTPLQHYFSPFNDYIPVDSLLGLRNAMELIAREPDFANEIALSGNHALLTNYAPARLWGALLNGLVT